MNSRLVARIIGLGLGVATALAGVSVPAVAAPAAPEVGTVLGAGRPGAIKDSYLVRIEDSASPRAAADRTSRELADRYGGTVRSAWRTAINGFSVRMTAAEAARMAADPRVASVEQDAKVTLLGDQANPPSWGLDRIDQRDLPLSSNYGFAATAANVHAYVLDTGIRIGHSDFGGRASWGLNAVKDGKDTDCHGHGTHVAGTVGGSQYGVAKDVRLVAVKVLDCTGSGTYSQIVDGVNWVTANAVKPAVVNMSLGGSGSSATMETAIRNSIASGVTYVVASGNSSSDACNFTPARVAQAITVNASDRADAQASFSNYGSCTDLYAPGVGITSAWNTGDAATSTISGTSMASPHVAGVTALWLTTHPTATPADVQAALLAAATPNKVTGVGAGSPNRLLFSNPGDPAPTPAPSPTPAPTLTDPGARTATIGTKVSLQLAASGGTKPYTWKATRLPTGLTVNKSGLVSGTPWVTGLWTVTATVTDAARQSASVSFTWTVTRPTAVRSPTPPTSGSGISLGRSGR